MDISTTSPKPLKTNPLRWVKIGRRWWVNFQCRLTSDDSDIDYNLGVVLDFALRSAKSENQITSILKNILTTDEADQIYSSEVRKEALKPFFQYFPKRALEMVCIPDDDGTFQMVKELVSDRYSERDEVALGHVPTEVLIDWCREMPGTRFAFAAGSCKLFEKQEDEKEPLRISDTAIEILKAAPDKATVIEEYIRLFYPSSWSGSLADILEKRRLLLDQLVIGDDEVIRVAIESAKGKLQNSINAERARDAKDERFRNLNFE